MSGPDEVIHQSVRLKIMAALAASDGDAPLEFPRLKAIVEASDGNLGAHLGTLEGAGYVAVTKEPVGKRTRTRIAMTPAGRKAFLGHIAYLRAIVDNVGP